MDAFGQAVERLAQTWRDAARMGDLGYDVLPHQDTALRAAVDGLESQQPGSGAHLVTALREDKRAQAAMMTLEGAPRAQALGAAIERQRGVAEALRRRQAAHEAQQEARRTPEERVQARFEQERVAVSERLTRLKAGRSFAQLSEPERAWLASCSNRSSGWRRGSRRMARRRARARRRKTLRAAPNANATVRI